MDYEDWKDEVRWWLEDQQLKVRGWWNRQGLKARIFFAVFVVSIYTGVLLSSCCRAC